MKRFLPLALSFLFILLIVFYLSFRVFEFFRPYLPYTPYLLGTEKPTTYLILLGNDAEMRANGGFTGSYAKVTLDNTQKDPNIILEKVGIYVNKKLNFKIEFQDIYVPNGHISGQYVAPPEPIQQAFGHGTWELANADWEPDFPSSAKTIRWFMEKGNEINPENLVLLNLTTIKKILSIVGSFPVPEYKATLNPDNLYLFLQGKAEVDFFPGSTQKRDALTAVGQAFIKKTKSLPLHQKIKIAQIIYTDLQNQNILINSTRQEFQEFLVEKNFAGVFQPEAMDTYSMIETNLGANKANAYVTRQTNHTITLSTNTTIRHQVAVKFNNSSIEANPNPPIHYGGDYITYLRFYVPAEATNLQITRTPLGFAPLKDPLDSSSSATIKPQYGLTEIGFWHTTTAGNESSVDLSYDLPIQNQSAYTLAVLKQHGLVTSPQTINFFGTSYTTDLVQSFYLP